MTDVSADDVVEAALKDLRAAEHDLAEAERESREARERIESAREALQRAEHQKLVPVHFKHLAEHERATFRVKETMTLQAVWDHAYSELELPHDQRDVLQAPGHPNPVDLMPHLTLSLKHAREQRLCDDHFEIAAATGGA